MCEKTTVWVALLAAAVLFCGGCVEKSHRTGDTGGEWRNLLADDLSNCIFKPGTWEMTDGVLFAKGGDNIWTKEKYADFIVDIEFKLAENTNSGVFLRTGDIVGRGYVNTCIEVQVLDSYGKGTPDKHDCGAIFDCLAPSKNMVKEPDRWNRYIITCRANKINVVLNGEQIIDMDLNLWTEAHKNPDGTVNKYGTAYKDRPRTGHIGLQYHGHPVWYRNARIKLLERKNTG